MDQALVMQIAGHSGMEANARTLKAPQRGKQWRFPPGRCSADLPQTRRKQPDIVALLIRFLNFRQTARFPLRDMAVALSG